MIILQGVLTQQDLTPEPGDFILDEGGEELLLESGDFLLNESSPTP